MSPRPARWRRALVASQVVALGVLVAACNQDSLVDNVSDDASPTTGEVAEALAAGGYQAVLLTSPSTVRALSAVPVAAGTVLGAIGAATTAAAADAGLPLAFTAAEPTDAALVAGLVRCAAAPPIRKS